MFQYDSFALLFLHLQIISMEQDNSVGISMMMTIKWKWDISFVFEAFTVDPEDTGLIILGMVVTLVVGILSVSLPSMKAKVQNRLFSTKKPISLLFQQSEVSEGEQEEKEKQKSLGEEIFSFCYVFLYSIMHILNMMLIMTYNGYVCIVVVIGMALGYTVFGEEKGKDKTMPVNCCA